ncbi:hypothetical protein [Microvirga sp. Mcv34]|uniref:hypothetical protein n=1 Tax=Microvirga sp. Mcv34 TaxID=2926016 RepID=UPI0021CA01CF|nr:hypothetical protein [Microvirga sp. Mcv34]
MSAKDLIRHHIRHGSAPVRADDSIPKGQFSLRDKQTERVVAAGKMTDKATPPTAGRVLCVNPEDYSDLGGV